MPHDPQAMAALREALCRYFPDPAVIKLRAQDAGLNVARLNLHQAAELVWQEVLEEAERLGRPAQERLVRGCVEKAPALDQEDAITAWLKGAPEARAVPGQRISQPKREGPSVEATVPPAETTTEPAPSLTWLHLSDLHFGQARGDAHLHFDQQAVVSALLTDATEVKARLGSPDVVVVTGDVAFSAKPAEYKLALQWFRDLCKVLEIGPEKLLMVPGNHDVDRGSVTGDETILDQHLAMRAKPTKLDNLLEPKKVVMFSELLWPKLTAFSQLVSDLGATPVPTPDRPFWVRALPDCALSSTASIQVVGLNSCLLSYDGSDAPSNLALGSGQIHRLFKDLSKDALVLALVHHPPSWQTDGSQLEARLSAWPHVLFSGHVHKPGGHTFMSFVGTSGVSLEAGACHAGAGEQTLHAYAWGRLYAAGLDYWPRVWNPTLLQFQPERNRFPDADGDGRVHRKRAKLPDRLEAWLDRAATAPAVPTHGQPNPWVPSAYRTWLERQYLTLSAGLTSGKALELRLKEVYVPLHTRWLSEEERERRYQWIHGIQDSAGRIVPVGPAAQERRALSELLHLPAQRHFLVRGGPGCGKSTFLRFTALSLLEATETELLPVLLELKDFGAWLGAHVEAGNGPELVLAWAADRLGSFGLNAKALRDRAGQGRVVWLLDGLDEIFDAAARARATQALGAFFCLPPQAEDRLLLTSREHAVTDPNMLSLLGLSERVADVEPLQEEEQAEFLRRWFAQVFRDNPAKGKTECDRLLERLPHHPEVRKLTPTPLMLSTMAAIFHAGKELPERRADLYDKAVAILLERRFGPQAPGGSGEKVRRVRDALAHVALAMMKDGAVRELGALEFQRLLEEGYCLSGVAAPLRRQEMERLALELGSHSGLVCMKGDPPRFEFTHLGYQEFMAARALAEEAQPIEAVTEHLDDGAWKETILLLCGYLAENGVARLGREFLEALAERRGSDAKLCRRLHLAVQGAVEAPQGVVKEPLLAELRRLAVEAISDPAQPCPVADRLELGLALGRLGDPRLGLEKQERWVWVPAETFQMGSDHGEPDERPMHKVKVSRGFWLGKYPVTNQEYTEFVSKGGYESQEWWDEAGWQAKTEEGWKKPDEWANPRFNAPNQPVVGVSWFEAAAFCRWLRGQWKTARPAWVKAGLEPRLPSEAEWELSARGTEYREYPWGNEDHSAERAWGLGSEVVGLIPSGASLFGAQDQAGTTCEWCFDQAAKLLYTSRSFGTAFDVRSSRDMSARVIMGSLLISRYVMLPRHATLGLPQGDRFAFVGFRLCLGHLQPENE